MKKKVIIIILLVLLIFTPVPVLARAGGGSSGGSGGSSGGGTGRSSHTTRGRSTYNQSPIERLASMAGFSLVMVSIAGFRVYKRRQRAIIMHREVSETLDILDDQDIFWNEKRIKQQVEKCYYAIQEAWSNQNLEVLKQYLSPSLYESWQIKLNWQQFQGQRNVLSNIKLLKHDVVNLYDSTDNNEDYFWVYIEGKMNDKMLDQENQIIESNNDVFVEYWKFIRNENNIYLDQILQQDEFEK